LEHYILYSEHEQE